MQWIGRALDPDPHVAARHIEGFVLMGMGVWRRAEFGCNEMSQLNLVLEPKLDDPL